MSSINCLILGKFSSVASKGRSGTVAGGSSLRGQEQWRSDSVVRPSLVQVAPVLVEVVSPVSTDAAATVARGGGQEPTDGKFGGMV